MTAGGARGAMTARGGARDRALATTTRAAAEVGASAAMVRFVCASRDLRLATGVRVVAADAQR